MLSSTDHVADLEVCNRPTQTWPAVANCKRVCKGLKQRCVDWTLEKYISTVFRLPKASSTGSNESSSVEYLRNKTGTRRNPAWSYQTLVLHFISFHLYRESGPNQLTNVNSLEGECLLKFKMIGSAKCHSGSAITNR